MITTRNDNDGLVSTNQLVVDRISRLKKIAILWLFPGLIMSLVFNEQTWLGPFGQILGWFNILAAIIIIFFSYQKKWLLPSLLVAIVSTKILAFFLPQFLLPYIFFLNTLFCLAGGIVAYEESLLVYRQLTVLCFLNFIFMVLQIVGYGEWTQVFASGWSMFSTVPHDMIFTTYDTMVFHKLYSHYQARPFGLMESNTFLQLLIMFATAMHFSINNGKKNILTLLMLSAMSVLVMSKIVFISIFLTIIVLIIFEKKLRYLLWGVLIILLIYLYSLIFPGLYKYNLSIETIINSVFFRINDLVDSLGYTKELQWLLKDTPKLDILSQGEHLSGYVALIQKAWMAIPAAIIFVTLYAKFCIKYKNHFFPKMKLIILNLIVILIFPLGFPAWQANIFAFIIGFSIFPLFSFLTPSYLRK